MSRLGVGILLFVQSGCFNQDINWNSAVPNNSPSQSPTSTPTVSPSPSPSASPSPSGSPAPVLTFRTVTTSQGLGNNVVNAVTTDAAGKVYVGTQGGLSISSDSGATSFSNITTSSGLQGNQVVAVLVDNTAGYIYVGMSNGFSASNNSGVSFNHLSSSDPVSSLAIDASSELYATVSVFVGYSNNNGSSFTHYTPGTSNAIYAVATSTTGVFIARQQEIDVSYDSAHSFSNFYTPSAGGVNFTTIAVDPTAQYIYAGSNGGLYLSSNSGSTFNNVISSTQVNGVAMDASFNIYAATSQGLYISYDQGATFSTYTNSNGLGSTCTNAVYVDQTHHMLYVGTCTGGLSIASIS